jgi:hypothetical protein
MFFPKLHSKPYTITYTNQTGFPEDQGFHLFGEDEISGLLTFPVNSKLLKLEKPYPVKYSHLPDTDRGQVHYNGRPQH